MRHCFQSRTCDMGFLGGKAKAAYRSARIGTPIGGTKARQGRHDINAAIIRNAARECFGFRGLRNQTQIIAKPLDQAARNKN